MLAILLLVGGSFVTGFAAMAWRNVTAEARGILVGASLSGLILILLQVPWLPERLGAPIAASYLVLTLGAFVGVWAGRREDARPALPLAGALGGVGGVAAILKLVTAIA